MVPFLAVAAAGAIDVEDDFFPLFPSTPLDPLELEVMAPPLKVVRSSHTRNSILYGFGKKKH